MLACEHGLPFRHDTQPGQLSSSGVRPSWVTDRLPMPCVSTIASIRSLDGETAPRHQLHSCCRMMNVPGVAFMEPGTLAIRSKLVDPVLQTGRKHQVVNEFNPERKTSLI